MNAPGDKPMPASSTHCIWMDAGIVGYKLCDRDFQCDRCPFDAVMRQPYLQQDNRNTEASWEPDRTPQKQLEEVLDTMFGPLLAGSFPADRIFHRGRTWVQRSPQNGTRIGMDHVGAGILDSLVTIVLPQTGSHLAENTPFCWLVQPEGTITMHAPVSGAVLSVNTLLVQRPELILTDPYGQGWIASVHLDEPEFHSPYFLTDTDVSKDLPLRLLRSQILHRCQQATTLGATLADGGLALYTLAELVGRKTFLELVGRMFQPEAGVAEKKV